MANYQNTFLQIVSAATASVSFTTTVDVQNHDIGSFQVVWNSLSHNTAEFRLKATIAGDPHFSNLTTNPTTMTSGTSSQLYDMWNTGYRTVLCEYKANGTTSGTIDVWVTRKSRR